MSNDISLWSERQRLRFIERVLFWRGFINRKDLVDRFGISPPQATNDLVNYSTRNSNGCAYNVRRKRYEAVPGFNPILIEPEMSADLHGIGPGVWPDPDSAFLAEPETPRRSPNPAVARELTQAAFLGESVEIHYWSVSSGTASWRRISPQAFAEFAKACQAMGYPGFKIHGWHDGDAKKEANNLLGVRAAVQLSDEKAARDLLERLLTHAPKSAHGSPALLEEAKLAAAKQGDPVAVAELYLRWLSHTPKAQPPARLSVAIRVRRVADTVLPDDARRWWERAGALLRPLWSDPAGLDASQQRLVLHHLWQTEHALALLYAKAEELLPALDAWKRAEPLVAKVHADNANNLQVIEARLRCLRELAAGAPAAPERGKRLATARALCGKLIRFRRNFAPEWWQAKEWQLQVMFDQGEYRMVEDLIENLRLLAPQLGNAEMRERLLDLQNRAKAKRGKR